MSTTPKAASSPSTARVSDVAKEARVQDSDVVLFNQGRFHQLSDQNNMRIRDAHRRVPYLDEDQREELEARYAEYKNGEAKRRQQYEAALERANRERIRSQRQSDGIRRAQASAAAGKRKTDNKVHSAPERKRLQLLGVVGEPLTLAAKAGSPVNSLKDFVTGNGAHLPEITRRALIEMLRKQGADPEKLQLLERARSVFDLAPLQAPPRPEREKAPRDTQGTSITDLATHFNLDHRVAGRFLNGHLTKYPPKFFEDLFDYAEKHQIATERLPQAREALETYRATYTGPASTPRFLANMDLEERQIQVRKWARSAGVLVSAMDRALEDNLTSLSWAQIKRVSVFFDEPEVGDIADLPREAWQDALEAHRVTTNDVAEYTGRDVNIVESMLLGRLLRLTSADAEELVALCDEFGLVRDEYRPYIEKAILGRKVTETGNARGIANYEIDLALRGKFRDHRVEPTRKFFQDLIELDLIPDRAEALLRELNQFADDPTRADSFGLDRKMRKESASG